MACSGSDPGGARQAVISREIRRRGADPAALIEVLHQVQLREGYLAAGALHQVARELRLPLSRVFGVASFYHLFRLTPPPRHRLALCHGTACFVNGAEELEAVLRARFAVGDAAGSRLERCASVAKGSAAGSVAGLVVGSAEREASASMTDRSAIRSEARPGEAEPMGAGAAPSMAAVSGVRSRHDGGREPVDGGLLDGSEGWRLERSGCLGACGHDPVLRLEDGPVLRLPLRPGVSLVERLAALGLPLLPQLPAPAL